MNSPGGARELEFGLRAVGLFPRLAGSSLVARDYEGEAPELTLVLWEQTWRRLCLCFLAPGGSLAHTVLIKIT